MGNPKGVRRDANALEKRRLKGADLLQQGVSQAEVSRRLGVSTASVCRWAADLKQRGRRGLKQAGRFGRKPRLTPQQTQTFHRVLKAGPEAAGFSRGLWTLSRVARAIEQTCGVSYHPGHVWYLLGKLGWSCQRPTTRAIERDEEAIARWKRYTWPALKKRPQKKAELASLSTKAD